MSETEIDDIVQEVMVQIVRSIGAFHLDSSKGRFRSWLKTIVSNKIRDHWRRQQTRRKHIARKLPVTSEDEPFEEVIHGEERTLLMKAMEAIRSSSNPTTWKCFEEHGLNERPAVEVAQELNLSVDAVYTNCSRTAARLHSRCQKLRG